MKYRLMKKNFRALEKYIDAMAGNQSAEIPRRFREYKSAGFRLGFEGLESTVRKGLKKLKTNEGKARFLDKLKKSIAADDLGSTERKNYLRYLAAVRARVLGIRVRKPKRP
ncbi:MAG: hypothetical protein NUV67_04850 [archaeon]|nr:hypothetical protein [archaeon]